MQPSAGDDAGAGVVDLDGALVPQVGKLGATYWKWVHAPSARPHYRMFPWDFVEAFSSTPWWAIPAVWLPIIAFLLHRAMGGSLLGSAPKAQPARSAAIHNGVDAHTLAALLVVGAALWTLLEYALHRWLFHMSVDPNSPFWITTHFILHGQHHKFPLDQGRLVFPPVAGMILASPFYIVFHLALPGPVADALIGGALLGYVGYDLTHYYLHHGQPSGSTYFGRLKAYHRAHHYKDYNKGEGLGEKGREREGVVGW